MPEGQLATAPLSTSGAVLDLMRSGFLSNLLSLRRSYSIYLATEVEKEVSEHDDMLAGGQLDHYLSVGPIGDRRHLAEGAWANNQDVVVLQKRPIIAGN
ncbi:MAG TPA: hypothetical protein VN808_00230 [Stellaceae bacterium]|nr:hypothetical protein [Stellaceae bacterium]